MVRPPPQTLDDLDDLTGEPGEIPPTAAALADDRTAPSALHVAPSDRSKVHRTHSLSPSLQHWVTSLL